MRSRAALDWLVLAAILSINLYLTVAARERHHRRVGLSHLLAATSTSGATNDATSANSLTSASTTTTTTSSSSPSSSLSSSTSTSRQLPFSPMSWLGPEFLLVRRIYDDCQGTNDFVGCLKQKAVTALSRAIEKDSIKIIDGVVLEKQNHTDKESIIDIVADARTFSSLAPIDRALLAKVDKLVRTHTLKLDMSTGREGGGGGGGGYKKKDKDGGHVKYVIAALLTAMGIAGPIGLKALAAIAGKALVISKVALTIASIIALKKLFSQDHHEETSFQVHAGEHNRRSTYVVRPLPKASAVPAVNPASIDPYRYYYEYH